MAYSDSNHANDAERLFVLNGELRGVSVPLDAGTFRVGSSSQCDVILLSSGDTEFEASFTSSGDGELLVANPIGDVRIGRRTLKSGNQLVAKAGIPIMIGDTRLMVAKSMTVAAQAEQHSSRRFTQIAWAASIVVIVGVVGTYELLSGRNAVLATPVYATGQGSTPLNSSSFIGAAKAIQEQLNSHKLSHIRASADNDVGTVKVRGRLRESEATRWKTVSTWFDSTYGGSIILDAKLVSVSDAITLPFSISAVWTGRESRLTLHDGSQRYLGDFLPGGWKLEKITPDQITISKGGESLMVPL